MKFTPTQQHILHCVRFNDGKFSRSELAKLLVGTTSSRVGEALSASPFYGRLSEHSRKAVMAQIDVLIQQGYLIWDEHQNVVKRPYMQK